jgi:ElaA protein
VTIQAARFADLGVDLLYGILRLRSEVFVVEQECVYLDPDGRDAEPDAWHLWGEEDGEVVVAGRLLRERSGAWRIGRVATAEAARGRGLAAALVQRAVELCDDGAPVELHAQSHLLEWYRTLGFEPSGAEYVEDGIPHTPMVLVTPVV